MYLEEAGSLVRLKESEELELLKLLYDSETQNNTRNTINKLIEGNLHLVLSILEDHKNKGVAAGDLIQEGNLGLTEGVSSYFSDSSGALDLREFHDYLLQRISRARSSSGKASGRQCKPDGQGFRGIKPESGTHSHTSGTCKISVHFRR